MSRHLPHLILALLLCAPAAAHAGDLPAEQRPWAEGVSAADQERARDLYGEGNAYLEEAFYGKALEKYERAIEYWDHPGIRFNMAIVYIKLERTVEAYQNIQLALRHGPEALGVQEYDQAINYKSVLEGQVARLTVTCAEPDAQVTLDGKHLFTGPGQRSKLVLTGEHQVVVSKPGRRTVTRSFQVRPRELNRVDLLRMPRDDLEVLVQRWTPWKPWAVAGAGAAITLLGIPLQLRAQANLDKYDAAIARECPDGSCMRSELDGYIHDMEQRARTQNRLAVASFVVGGAVLATGLTLVILNRPRPVPAPRTPEVAPLIGADSLGVTARFSF